MSQVLHVINKKDIKLKIELRKDLICSVFFYFAAWSSFHETTATLQDFEKNV